MKLNISNENDSLDKLWKSGVFGPHPYTLIIASKKKVEFIDFRVINTEERSLNTKIINNNINNFLIHVFKLALYHFTS